MTFMKNWKYLLLILISTYSGLIIYNGFNPEYYHLQLLGPYVFFKFPLGVVQILVSLWCFNKLNPVKKVLSIIGIGIGILLLIQLPILHLLSL